MCPDQANMSPFSISQHAMCYYSHIKMCWSYANTAGLCNDNRMKCNLRKKSKWKIIIKKREMWGDGVCFLFFFTFLWEFSSAWVAVWFRPCHVSALFCCYIKNIIRYRASMVNSAGWKSRVVLPRQIDVTLSVDWLNLSATAWPVLWLVRDSCQSFFSIALS